MPTRVKEVLRGAAVEKEEGEGEGGEEGEEEGEESQTSEYG